MQGQVSFHCTFQFFLVYIFLDPHTKSGDIRTLEIAMQETIMQQELEDQAGKGYSNYYQGRMSFLRPTVISRISSNLTNGTATRISASEMMRRCSGISADSETKGLNPKTNVEQPSSRAGMFIAACRETPPRETPSPLSVNGPSPLSIGGRSSESKLRGKSPGSQPNPASSTLQLGESFPFPRRSTTPKNFATPRILKSQKTMPFGD